MRKLITLISILLFGSVGLARTVRPQTVQQFSQTSVRIYSTTSSSGGTGSILKSTFFYSEVLTNKHICRIIEQGGQVEQNGKFYPIIEYKKYTKHDLCIVRVLGNLGVSTVISKTPPKKGSKTFMSGHPKLLPHIVNGGHMTSNMTIQLVVGTKSCTESDREDPNKQFYCMLMGGIPVVKKFESTVLSNLIQGGNSGSAVYNSYGEVVAVAFAGAGDISYSFVVPYKYVADFTRNHKRYKWVEVGTEVDNGDLDERFFNYKKCTSILKSEQCKTLNMNMIWSK